jgi:hypothetical protein
MYFYYTDYYFIFLHRDGEIWVMSLAFMQHDDSLNWFLFPLYISISVLIHAATPAITGPNYGLDPM